VRIFRPLVLSRRTGGGPCRALARWAHLRGTRASVQYRTATSRRRRHTVTLSDNASTAFRFLTLLPCNNYFTPTTRPALMPQRPRRARPVCKATPCRRRYRWHGPVNAARRPCGRYGVRHVALHAAKRDASPRFASGKRRTFRPPSPGLAVQAGGATGRHRHRPMGPGWEAHALRAPPESRDAPWLPGAQRRPPSARVDGAVDVELTPT